MLASGHGCGSGALCTERAGTPAQSRVALADVLDLDNLARRVAEGFIAERKGPDGLRLWNYTAKAQFDRVWDNETRRCRGLVGTDDGYVVSRPFEKFFNASEHETLPVEPFDVYDKLDGSMIAAAAHPSGRGVLLTSRGSFDSDQARAAQRLWCERYVGVTVPAGQTWCFELIAPRNRIVVNYGDQEDLILLAMLDNATGRDFPLAAGWPGPVVDRMPFTLFDDIVARLSSLGPDEEGYVVRFRESGLRVKLKGEEYVRLHRLITGVTARSIWEELSAGRSLDALLDRVPDEFNRWIRETASGLARSYLAIEWRASDVLDRIKGLPTRKDQALAVARDPNKHIIFRMLDGKPYEDVIWKMIYPPHVRPFYKVSEDNA